MRVLTLRRIESGDAGTFGVLEYGGRQFFTGELPWRENQPGKSCIPVGIYVVKHEWSPRFERCLYELKGTPKRAEVKFHPANFFGDEDLGLRCEVKGCIGLGKKLGNLQGQRALLQSQDAVREFEILMQKDSFKLAIENHFLPASNPTLP